jgi:hypothetical protein
MKKIIVFCIFLAGFIRSNGTDVILKSSIVDSLRGHSASFWIIILTSLWVLSLLSLLFTISLLSLEVGHKKSTNRGYYWENRKYEPFEDFYKEKYLQAKETEKPAYSTIDDLKKFTKEIMVYN